MKEGYLYIARGEQWIKEAHNSAVSLRKVEPKAHITLVTNNEISDPIFDGIVVRPCNDSNDFWDGLLYKVRCIYECSPYKRTFYIDTDTFVLESISGAFELLEYFDVCVAPAPGEREIHLEDGRKLAGCVAYNTGVVLFRKSEANGEFFANWSELYERRLKDGTCKKYGETDQTPFNLALLNAHSRLFVLPPVWNARTFSNLYFFGSVKIIHARYDDYEKVGKKLNKSSGQRAWIAKRQKAVF